MCGIRYKLQLLSKGSSYDNSLTVKVVPWLFSIWGWLLCELWLLSAKICYVCLNVCSIASVFVVLYRRQLVNLQEHTAYRRHLEHLEVCGYSVVYTSTYVYIHVYNVHCAGVCVCVVCQSVRVCVCVCSLCACVVCQCVCV